MFEAFRVGPVETMQGTFVMLAALSPSGLQSVVTTDDREGLAELLQRSPAGLRTCEPNLAKVGASIGFRSAPLSDAAKHAKASLAMMLVYGRGVDPKVIQHLEQTIECARHFMRARPWQLVRPEVPVEVTIALGGRDHRLVASVLGADGVEFGIALHENAHALARFVDLCERDRLEEARLLPMRSLTIDREPAWAAEAVAASYGEPLVPFPTATGGKGDRTVSPEDLSMLAGAVFAISKLGPGRLTAEITNEVPGGTCRVTVRIPDGAVIASRPAPAWTERPSRVTGAPAALLTVPVLPVTDLRATVAALRALGFDVPETEGTATAVWPGVAIELVDVPASRGGACHIVVEAIDPLVAIWTKIGVEIRVVENGRERVAVVELPGDLTLTLGEQFPLGFKPVTKPRRRAPRKRD